MDITGQGVVVTGAARGIGRAIAVRLVREGARVVINDLDPQATAQAAAEVGAIALPGDAASEAGIATLIERAREQLGAIDIWFANAGVISGVGLAASEQEWDLSWQVNTMAHVRAARLLVPDWLERGGGRFVVTASAAGLLTALGSASYSATKHAAIGFAEWLQATYQHRGIVVQAICPQGVSTAMLEQAGAVRSVLVADGTLTPQDVADAAWEGLQDNRFLILPHPSVADYYRHRATDTDRWLRSMNRLQQGLEQEATP